MSTENVLTRVRGGRHSQHPEHGPTPDPVTPDLMDAARFAEWLEKLRTELSQSINGITLKGAGYYTLRTGASSRPTVSASAIMGWSVRETSGTAPALIVFRDGQDASADEVAAVSLAAGESVRDWFGAGGISLLNGLYVHQVSGAIAGAVYLGGAQ